MTEPIQIILPTFDNSTVNAWLFLEPEPVLIDCGEKSEASWQALNKGLEKAGIGVADIKKIVITHAHVDHIGLANQIVEHSDAMVYVSEYVYDWAVDLEACLDKRRAVINEIMAVNKPSAKGRFSFGYKELAPYWEEIPKDRLKVFSVDGTLNFGGQDWEVIYTPGHCVNQTCFYQRETKQFFSADALLKIFPIPIIDYGIKPPYHRTKSVPETIETFRMIQRMDIEKVYPGHWAAFENPNALIEKQLKRTNDKIERTFQLIKSGTSDFFSLLNTIYANRINPATMFMMLGFLDILLDENRITKEEKNGQLFYF